MRAVLRDAEDVLMGSEKANALLRGALLDEMKCVLLRGFTWIS